MTTSILDTCPMQSIKEQIAAKMNEIPSSPSQQQSTSVAAPSSAPASAQSPRPMSPAEPMAVSLSVNSTTAATVASANAAAGATTTVVATPAPGAKTPKRAAKDVLSAQILIGMKNMIAASSPSSTALSPNSSLSAPSSPLPIQAPLSPFITSDSEGAFSSAAAGTSTSNKPSSPRSDHQLPSSSSIGTIQTTCTFKECLICSRGTPFVNNKSPTWACIMRIVFYCLQHEMPQKTFLNLKTDVYGFMTAHWHLLCLDKKRSDNWHKQIQDMLSHSKNLFKSGMDTYKQNGYWRMKQISDPWDEIKAKKVLTKRKRSYSEADKDSSKHHDRSALAAPAVATPAPSTSQALSPANIVTAHSTPAAHPVSSSPLPTFTSSIDKAINDTWMSTQLKSKELANACAPITSSKSNSTPKLKKKLKVTHQAPIPTIPILISSVVDSLSNKLPKQDSESDDVNIEDDDPIYDDESSPMSLLLLSSTAKESKNPLIPPLAADSQSTTGAASFSPKSSSNSVEAANVPPLPTNPLGFSTAASGIPSAPTSPPSLSSSSSSLYHKEEEINFLKHQLHTVLANLGAINQATVTDIGSLQSMINKEIQRITGIYNAYSESTNNAEANNSSSNNLIIDESSSTITSDKQQESSTSTCNTTTNTNSDTTGLSPTKPCNTSLEQSDDDVNCVPSISGLSALSMVATNI